MEQKLLIPVLLALSLSGCYDGSREAVHNPLDPTTPEGLIFYLLGLQAEQAAENQKQREAQK